MMEFTCPLKPVMRWGNYLKLKEVNHLSAPNWCWSGSICNITDTFFSSLPIIKRIWRVEGIPSSQQDRKKMESVSCRQIEAASFHRALLRPSSPCAGADALISLPGGADGVAVAPQTAVSWRIQAKPSSNQVTSQFGKWYIFSQSPVTVI